MTIIRALLCALALAAAGCSDGVETPTSSTTTAPATILFSGTLQPGAIRFYSYSVAAAGSVTAMLASLERNGVPAGHTLEIGLGVPAGTGCAVSTAASTTTSLVPQLRQEVPIGTYCVRLADVEGLPAPMTFTIRVIHP